MNEHRFKETKNDLNMTVAQVVRDMAEIRIDEEKASAKERIKNWRDLYESKPTLNNEFEEFKKTYFEEIEQIKQKQLSDKEAYEKEKEDLLAQRVEIEQELNTLKNQSNEISAVPHSISYDV